MAKEKKIKVKKKIDWKHEMALAPGYIIVILWVAFTFMLLGWIIAASLSTTTDIFAGKALKFPSGLHFENYVQAWGSGGVATFFTNSLLYAVVSCVLLILICAPAAYVLARYTFIGNKIIQTSLVSAMGIPITMIVLPLFGVVANLGILNNVAASKVTLIFLYVGINIPYTTIKLSGGNILMYNSSQMCVMNSRGVQKYLGSVDGTIKDFFKIGMNRYLLVLDSGVEIIKLS